MKTTRFAWLGAIALGMGGSLITGCSSSADPQEAASALAGEICDLSFRCCTRGEVSYYLGPYVGENDCADRLVHSANLGNSVSVGLAGLGGIGVYLPNLKALDQAVSDGRTKVDQDAVDACADYLASVSCNEVVEAPMVCTPPEFNLELPCDPDLMFQGQVEDGGRCSSVGFSIECQDGLTCRAPSGLGTDGVCVAPGDIGDYCFTDGECRAELYCSQLDGTCAEFAQPGEVCAFADPDDPAPSPNSLLIKCDVGLSCDPVTDTCVAPCERGATCNQDLDCDVEEGLTCILGRCETPREETLPCAVDEHCAEGLKCLPSTVQLGVLFCTPPRDVGEPCTYASHSECASGYCDFSTGECAASSEPGELCVSGAHQECAGGYCNTAYTSCSTNDQCLGGGVCNVGLGRCEYYCVERRADNQDCLYSYECASDACVSGKCRTLPLADGQECNNAFECESSYCGYGTPRTCDTPPLPNGTECVSDSVCESGICFENACSPGLTEDSACGDFDQPPCARDLYCDPEDPSPTCVPKLDTGEVCKADYQCRGACEIKFGRLVCDDTPPADGLVCDGT